MVCQHDSFGVCEVQVAHDGVLSLEGLKSAKNPLSIGLAVVRLECGHHHKGAPLKGADGSRALAESEAPQLIACVRLDQAAKGLEV